MTVAPAVERGERALERRGVAERRRHQQEARLRQGEERHLPGDAAIAVGVVVELVHDDVVDVGVRALAQRDVGEDLGGAAEDRRVAVHRGVAGRQADVLRPELAAQVHPLLVHQRLDRTGVDGALAARERREEHRRGHQRLARAGRRVQDDVLAVEEREDRLFLGRVERQASSAT